MPRYRKYNRRRFNKRSKRVPGWGGAIGRVAGVGMKYVSKGGLAYKALRLARKVANAVNVEYKAFDVQSTAGAVDYNGGVTSLMSGLAQGAADNQRIGDSLKVQNLTFRCFGARNGQDAWLRYMIIYDPQNQISSVTDVLAATGSGQSIVAPKNYDKRFRCRILHEKHMALTSGNPTLQMDDQVIPIDLHTQFSGGTTTILTGDIKLLVISNVVTTNLPTFTYYARLSYTDN